MNLVNQQVQHPKYGCGTIMQQSETCVIVQFGEDNAAKKFFYPAAFEKFLTLENPGMQEFVRQELQERREKENEEQRRKEAAFEQAVEEKRHVVTEKKQAALKRRIAARRAAADRLKRARLAVLNEQK